MGLRSLVSRRRPVRSSTTLNLAQVADYFKFGGLAYQLGLRQTLVGDTQTISPGFQGVIEGAYKANGVVFACELARIMLFSEARMVFRRLRGGRPAGVFSTPALRPLEQPWAGAKTGDLLTRALLDIDFAGTFVAAKRQDGTVRRLRPDWTKIVYGGEGSGQEFHDLDATIIGYYYTPGGDGSGNRPRFLDRKEAVHWTLIPDPLGPASGIPWIEAVIREVLGDQAMTAHKLKFFSNGATPNIVIETDLDGEDLREFVKSFRSESEGLDHAYETMWLASAMKANVVGVDLKQLDFKITQGGGETRVAAAAGVPPVIVGLSEGLQAATYSCPASELVWTADGPRPIALLAPGDKVWSLEQGRPVLRPVTWAGRTGMQVVHTIKTKNRTFHATGNHPVYMPDGSYRLVDDLEVGDRVCAPTSLPDLGGTTLPDGGTATAEIMGWLGAYIGDGCLNGDHGVRMCIPRDDRVRAHYEQLPPRLFTKATAGQWQKPSRRASDGLTEEMVALRDTGMTFRAIRDTMGLEMHPMSVRDRVRTATREYEGAREPVVVGECRYGFQFHSKEAVAWHHLMGVTGTARTKRVPGWVFGLSEPLRLAFLAGIVDTDGSVGKDGRLVVQFANRELVEDVRMLLVSCGIQCSNVAHYEYSARVLPNPGRSRTYEAWRFTASSARDVGRIPFTDPVYRERVDGNAHRHRLNRSGTFRITSIERGTVRVPVYDIEVDGGDHIFLANGVAVHNSNYGQARRRFADGTMRPLWRSFCGALEPLIDVPADAELWYDDRDIAFLQEDASDDAEILHRNAESIRTLTDAGYTPDSVVAAVMAGDLTQLVHTGLFSVQLLPSGTQMANGNGNGNGNGQAQPALAKPQ